MLAGMTLCHGQFGIRFDDDSFTARGYQAVYSFQSGQLLMMTDTSQARHEGYIFINPETGDVLSSFFLDSRHGAQLSPDGTELLMAGSDGTVRTIARYSPSSLELVERVGINLGDNLASTDGIGGNFEPTPDGHFIFNGTDTPDGVNFIARFDREFNQLWARSFQFEGAYALPGVVAYPLAGGHVGFFAFFNRLNPVTSQAEIIDVFGLLDGETGDLVWTFTYRPPLGGINNRIEDFRYTFGSDGSFFAHAAAIIDISNPTAPVDRSAAKVLRINADGSLAYSKTVTLPDSVVTGENYMDGYTLLHYTYNDEDSTQFVVLDASGNVTGNTSIDFHLSAGDGDLTATRRAGTDIAFVRAEFSPGGHTLARLDLSDGSMEFRQLPPELPGNPVYEAVGGVDAYPAAPYNTPESFPSVSTVLAAELVTGFNPNFRLDLIELPSDGSFPECITYTPSTISPGTALTVESSDIEFIDLESGWTVSEYPGLPGLSPSDVAPDLQPMTPVVETLCEDDSSGGDTISISFVRTGPGTAELSFETTDGVTYAIQRTGVMDGETPFADLQSVEGDGETSTTEVQLSEDQEYFRVIIP